MLRCSPPDTWNGCSAGDRLTLALFSQERYRRSPFPCFGDNAGRIAGDLSGLVENLRCGWSRWDGAHFRVSRRESFLGLSISLSMMEGNTDVDALLIANAATCAGDRCAANGILISALLTQVKRVSRRLRLRIRVLHLLRLRV